MGQDLVISQSFCNFRHTKKIVMPKLHFRPYICNQTVLFPQRIDENIAENDPVRLVNAVVEGLNLDNFRKLYKERGVAIPTIQR